MQQCMGVFFLFFFLSRVEEKLPLMWRFHNPPSFIYQGVNTHTDWQQPKKVQSLLLFSASQCFFFFFQSQGCVYGGERCVNVGYQTGIKGWITLVWCVSAATSLECYSCSAESSDNCNVKQQCNGSEDSCLRLSSNGKALITQSDVGDFQTSSWLFMLRQKRQAKRSKSQDFDSANTRSRMASVLGENPWDANSTQEKACVWTAPPPHCPRFWNALIKLRQSCKNLDWSVLWNWAVLNWFRSDLRWLYQILRLQLSDPGLQVHPPWIHLLLLSVKSLQQKEEELVQGPFWIGRFAFPCKMPTKSSC